MSGASFPLGACPHCQCWQEGAEPCCDCGFVGVSFVPAPTRRINAVIIAKFKCIEISKRESWNTAMGQFLYAAKLQPVMGGSPENDQFFAASPSGSIELSTVKADHFEVGREYMVHFTPCMPGAC